MDRAMRVDILADIRAGRPVVVTDDRDREDEADLVVAADRIRAETVNFMATHGRGLICVAMESDRLEALELPLMVERNTTPNGTAFTIPVDVRHGTTTGISAFDRARTIRALVDPSTRPEDLVRPGHVFPLRARPGGLAARRGHTEAAVALARLAGCFPAGVICEILADDGRMARGDSLAAFVARHALKVVSIDRLISWEADRSAGAAPDSDQERDGRRIAAPTDARRGKDGEFSGPRGGSEAHVSGRSTEGRVPAGLGPLTLGDRGAAP